AIEVSDDSTKWTNISGINTFSPIGAENTVDTKILAGRTGHVSMIPRAPTADYAGPAMIRFRYCKLKLVANASSGGSFHTVSGVTVRPVVVYGPPGSSASVRSAYDWTAP